MARNQVKGKFVWRGPPVLHRHNGCRNGFRNTRGLFGILLLLLQRCSFFASCFLHRLFLTASIARVLSMNNAPCSLCASLADSLADSLAELVELARIVSLAACALEEQHKNLQTFAEPPCSLMFLGILSTLSATASAPQGVAALSAVSPHLHAAATSTSAHKKQPCSGNSLESTRAHAESTWMHTDALGMHPLCVPPFFLGFRRAHTRLEVARRDPGRTKLEQWLISPRPGLCWCVRQSGPAQVGSVKFLRHMGRRVMRASEGRGERDPPVHKRALLCYFGQRVPSEGLERN